MGEAPTVSSQAKAGAKATRSPVTVRRLIANNFASGGVRAVSGVCRAVAISAIMFNGQACVHYREATSVTLLFWSIMRFGAGDYDSFR